MKPTEVLSEIKYSKTMQIMYPDGRRNKLYILHGLQTRIVHIPKPRRVANLL